MFDMMMIVINMTAIDICEKFCQVGMLFNHCGINEVSNLVVLGSNK